MIDFGRIRTLRRPQWPDERAEKTDGAVGLHCLRLLTEMGLACVCTCSAGATAKSGEPET